MRLSLKRYGAFLFKYLKPQWGKVLLMLLSLFLNVALQLLSPQIIGYFIDTALAQGISLSLAWAGVFFAVTVLATQMVSIATIYLSQNVAWTATNQLRSDLVAHCLSLDMSFHKAHTAGELIERIDGDVEKLSNFFSQFTGNIISSLLMVIGTLTLFYLIDIRSGLAMTGFVLLTSIILNYFRRRGAPLWLELSRVRADYSSFLGEHLAATEDIRANGAVQTTMRRFFQLLQRWLPINRRAEYNGLLMGTTLLLLFIFGSSLNLSLGAYLWSIGAVTIGTIYVMFAYTDRLSRPVEQLQLELQDLQQVEAALMRIDELLQTQSQLQQGNGSPMPSGALSVNFERVTFGYVPDEPVLENITFELPAGQVLGIVGRTGSGKTTLARLLARLYDPQSGQICLSGVPVQSANLHMLRQRVGMVTQDVQIFQASVRDNLTFFDRSIPDRRILEVLEDVGLTDWYRSLPQGLDSELGSGGEGLSAGEAQLLAFARVFLKDPGLVILDEASSRLDPATEYLIEQAITKLFSGRTGVIIAHRLSTLQRADTILALEHGHILEHGPRAELAANPSSHFAHLLHTARKGVLA